MIFNTVTRELQIIRKTKTKSKAQTNSITKQKTQKTKEMEKHV